MSVSGGMCSCASIAQGTALASAPAGANAVIQTGPLGGPAAPAAVAPAGELRPALIGASPDEAAKIHAMLDRASASPTAQRLFADLQRTGLTVAVKDDALDPVFARPTVAAYEHNGVVHLRRSHFTDPSKADVLFEALIHESVHAADSRDPTRIAPAVRAISQGLANHGNVDARRIETERRGMMESRAFTAAQQVLIELGINRPGPAGGFGQTGRTLGSVAQQLVTDNRRGYALGVNDTVVQFLSDAVLGHALLA